MYINKNGIFSNFMYTMVNLLKNLYEFIIPDIKECASNPCMNGATCNEGINKYTCTCVSGYNVVNCEEGGWEFQKCLLSTGVSYGQVYSKTVFTVV